tara:strand:+ start:626 stop:730 length:105 start_codon:yes stop_codon:yes gene_type:complete
MLKSFNEKLLKDVKEIDFGVQKATVQEEEKENEE